MRERENAASEEGFRAKKCLLNVLIINSRTLKSFPHLVDFVLTVVKAVKKGLWRE